MATQKKNLLSRYLEHYALSHVYESILVRPFWNPKLGQKITQAVEEKK
jgi:hypothetical protein